MVKKTIFILRRLKTPPLMAGMKAVLVFRPWEPRALARVGSIIGYALAIISFAGCSLIHRPTSAGVGVASLPSYSGPKAQIAVADFEVKAAKATGEIGSGLREMLLTALINSNRFTVVERQQQAAAIKEQELSVSGAGSAANGAGQKEKNKNADLIISVAVIEFEPQASGGRAGVGGGGGGGSGLLGGLLGTPLNKAHITLDINIVDASTSKAVAATRVQGLASDTSGAKKNGLFGSGNLGTGLSSYANSPMEKAIRICIIEAIRYISQSIPASYYKY